jgi:hypothetical protein
MVFHAVTFMFRTKYQTIHNIRSLYQTYHTDKKNKYQYSVYQKHFCVNVLRNLIKANISQVDKMLLELHTSNSFPFCSP